MKFLLYLLVMAGVTYLVRMIPLVLVKKKIQNKFILSFLYYVPYSVLTVMTIPGIFYATGSFVTAAVGFAVAVLLSLKGKSLVTVALLSSAGVLLTELLLKLV
jgi:branched-subunit amino acid transport protein